MSIKTLAPTETASPTVQPLDKKDVRLIQRCCVCPPIAVASIAMVVALCVPWFLGTMIGDLVFFGEGDFKMFTVCLYPVLAAILTVVFAYCALASKLGLYGKHWRALADRLQVIQEGTDRAAETAGVVGLVASGSVLRGSGSEAAQALGGVATVAGAASAVALTADEMAEAAGNARAMANAYGVQIPSAKRAVLAIVIVPLLIMGVAFGARYVSAAEAIQRSQVVAAARIEVLTEAFGDAGLLVDTVGDPAVEFSDSGYTVYGYLSGESPFDDDRDVRIDLDKNGVVTEVWYNHRIDLDLSLEENLALAQQDFDTLNAPLASSGAAAETDALLSRHELSDEFCQQFLAGDVRTPIRLSERADDCDTYSAFSTDDQGDFEEYNLPEIWFSVYSR